MAKMSKEYQEWFAKTPKTHVHGLTLFHPEVVQLGEGVAENVARLIQLYAQRISLASLPPITLDGPGWDQPFDIVGTLDPCSGDAGSSYAASRKGINYQSLLFMLPNELVKPNPDPDHSRKLEGIIAHEIVHLRWWNLQHGAEFTARVLALLKGCNFPAHSGWNKKTRAIMDECRQEHEEWCTRIAATLLKERGL
jgi:hypothetical protein